MRLCSDLSGWGFGAFESAYGLWERGAVKSFFAQAHNSYLENAMELGLPMVLILYLGLALLLSQISSVYAVGAAWCGTYARF